MITADSILTADSAEATADGADIVVVREPGAGLLTFDAYAPVLPGLTDGQLLARVRIRPAYGMTIIRIR